MSNRVSIFQLNLTPTYGFQSDISQDRKVANPSILKSILATKNFYIYTS